MSAPVEFPAALDALEAQVRRTIEVNPNRDDVEAARGVLALIVVIREQIDALRALRAENAALREVAEKARHLCKVVDEVNDDLDDADDLEAALEGHIRVGDASDALLAALAALTVKP